MLKFWNQKSTIFANEHEQSITSLNTSYNVQRTTSLLAKSEFDIFSACLFQYVNKERRREKENVEYFFSVLFIIYL